MWSYFRYRTDDVWFATVPVSVNTKASVVSHLRKSAGLVFSNHTLRATAATRLFESYVDKKLIKLKTGHTSDAVRHYKCMDTDELESMSNVVACKKTKA